MRRLKGCVERLHVIGYLKNKSCTSTLTQGRIYCMCASWSNGALIGRITWRDMWESHRRKIFGLQSLHPGILVTEHPENLSGLCEEVWPMSKICPKYSSTRGSLKSTFQLLAIFLVGLGHSEIISLNYREPKVAHRRDRLFYQMGKSWATC